MNHLIISREYPPAAYTPGGIGTYVQNMARLLAEAGETVHVIGQRWQGASKTRERLCNGRLVIYRVAPEDEISPERDTEQCLAALRRTGVDGQWFAYQAALLAERLIEEEGVDVVEGQEWEAPLYYLQVRRALGLGPSRRPPCIVHLHSPTELIVRANGWDPTGEPFLTMKRMEDYTIRNADAWLCPSGFLARQCESHYGLPAGAVRVIPLPVGGTRVIERERAAWEGGRICFVGRLEPRKGVIEWVQAATSVAREFPAARFDFIGADMAAGAMPGAHVPMRCYLETLIPAQLRHRFRFHEAVPRERLSGYLAAATAAVIPSRWENFPNTCIEAMGSGLPVIATRFGGMGEMVEDGVSGWLADAEDMASMVPALAGALRRCLSTPALRRREMGTAAAEAIRGLCDNRRITENHVDFRARVARGKAGGQTVRAADGGAGRRGIGVAVRIAPPDDGAGLLDTLRRQSRPPEALVVVGRADPGLRARVEAVGGRFVPREGLSTPVAWNSALTAAGDATPVAWLFLDQDDRLHVDAVDRLAKAFEASPGLGVVSCWTAVGGGAGRLYLPPSPELPYLWANPGIAHATAFRAEALADPFGGGKGLWELALELLARGWAGVTYPEALARRVREDLPLPWAELASFRERRLAMMQRHPELLAAGATALVDLYAAPPTRPPALPSVRSALTRRAAGAVAPSGMVERWRGAAGLLGRSLQCRLSRKPALHRVARALSSPVRLAHVLRRLTGSAPSTAWKSRETL